MKKYFITTYWAVFTSENGSQHSRVERFWFWRAPQFFDWHRVAKEELEKVISRGVITLNCGKV